MFGLFKKKQKTGEDAPRLCYNTDLHSHILPGLDDGAQTVEESLELINAMKRWGIKHIITTPHTTESTFENDENTIRSAYEYLLDVMEQQQVTDINLSFSSEYRIDATFFKQRGENMLLSLNEDYLLVENSFIQPYIKLTELLFNLQMEGYIPILAHPERYLYYKYNTAEYRKIHDGGTLFQVNLLSFSGYYGQAAKDQANWLLKQGYVDLMSTDLHSIKQVQAIDKFLCTKEYKRLEGKLNLLNNKLFKWEKSDQQEIYRNSKLKPNLEGV